MKIAYLTEWSPRLPTGVLRKILGQVTAWKSLGHSVLLFSLSPLYSNASALDYDSHGEVFGVICQSTLERYRWARLGYVNKILTAPRIVRRLRHERPDILYYRQQGPWYPGLSRILKCAPCVMEINTLPSEVNYWGRGMALLANATNSGLWSEAAAFVCVSHASANVFSELGKPVKVVPNSMWGSPNMRLPPSGNRVAAFIFVGSAGQSWHGVDKILRLASDLPDHSFHVVGLSREEIVSGPIPINVMVHGALFGKDLVDVYRQSDVGLSTLALHRLGFDNTSSLKTLEYLMYGLPVVLGCRETADQLNNADYTLSLPNTPSNTVDHVNAIREFANRWCSRRVTDDLTYLSRATIERQRLGFLEEVVVANHTGNMQTASTCCGRAR